MPRNYEKEYETFQKLPKQKKNRASRNAARRKMQKEGRVTKGDGKDVHHRDGNPRNNSKGNLSILTKGINRKKK